MGSLDRIQGPQKVQPATDHPFRVPPSREGKARDHRELPEDKLELHEDAEEPAEEEAPAAPVSPPAPGLDLEA